MEEFVSIDWNPPLEDMLVTKFIDTERLQNESAMYRILRGTFSDPFENLHEDYNDLVTPEMMTECYEELKEEKEQTKSEKGPVAKVQPKKVQQCNVVPEKVPFAPGYGIRGPIHPKTSSLTAEQQALCVKLLVMFSGAQKPEISAHGKEELNTYMSLLPTITKEQDEFLEFAKQQWDSSPFTIHEEEYINQQWKRKVKVVESLPRYYTETSSIPFVSPKEIGINFHSTCLEMGTLPKIILPKFTKRSTVPTNTTKINQRYFAESLIAQSPKDVIYKTPVSQDPNCEKLAKDHEVDMVISSAGLNCVAVNMDPNNTISWILPISVKRVNDKNVVFVDKPLPPTGQTVMQKNAWFYKYTLKAHMIHPYHLKSLNLDEEGMEKLAQCRKIPHWDSNESLDAANAQADSETPMQVDATDAIGSREGNEGDEKNDGFVRPPTGHNLFYRLFSIGSCSEVQNELMKNRVDKVYKILVRTKCDGATNTPKGEQQVMMIVPKLEHQLGLGAEALTADEAAKQWMSLTFRPDTTLARVRIDAVTSEAIQIEKRTPASINNEIKRLYSLKTEAALTLLYNVAETMTGLNPGSYLIRHTVRNGAFASVYKQVDGPGKNALDLQAVYCEDEFRTIPNAAWPMLDKAVVTPVQKHFKRMPALFRPKMCPAQMKKKGGKKTKKKKGNVVRKSARNKGSPASD